MFLGYEVRYKREGVKKLYNDYVMVYKGRQEERRFGVAIVMTPEMYRHVTETVLVNDRIMAVTWKAGESKLSIICDAPRKTCKIKDRVLGGPTGCI